jgi:general secretion pathway protein A
MYQAFFGLKRMPFDAVADPAFLYETPGQLSAVEAIADLVRRRHGVITLEGWPGAGKTELLRAYDRGVDIDRVRVRAITRHDFDPPALLAILGEMLAEPFAPPPPFEALKGLLTARVDAGQAIVLLIDNAEELTDGALHALGAVADLTKDEFSLLSIVLAVRPPFVELFSRPAAAALDRRASVRVRLPLLTPSEAGQLLEHRLRQAGVADPHAVLSSEAIEAIVVEAGGIPRRLLSLGDRVLQAGAIRQRMPVDYATAEGAIRSNGKTNGHGRGNGGTPSAPTAIPPRIRPPISVEPRRAAPPSRAARRTVAAINNIAIPAMLLVVAIGLGYWLWNHADDVPPQQQIAVAPPPPGPSPPAETPPLAAPQPATAVPPPHPAPTPVAAPAPPAAPASPVNVLFISARRGDTLRSLYRAAYRTPRYRPSFEQMLAVNPDLPPEKKLQAGELVALPGPLLDR